MTYDEIVAKIYELTKRPDLVAQTDSAIRLATLKAHHTDYYSKDIYEEGLDFKVLSSRHQWDYIQTVPNFRAFKYFRLAEDACDESGPFIDIITPDELLDAYGCNRSNIGYVAGRVFEIRAATDFRFALMACYVHPSVQSGNYCSWVAEQYPDAIINEACRVIFKSIGYDEQSAQYNALAAESFALLKLSNIQDVGY